MENKKVMKIASAGKRFGAWVIDQLIFWVVLFVCGLLMSIPFGMMHYDDYVFTAFGGLLGMTVVGLFLIAGIAYLVIQLYFYSKGQSIGKSLVGLMVVHKKDGTPLTFWWMLLREVIVKKASEVVFCLGYIWILVDDNRQGWHDKILDTYVIDDKETASLVRSISDDKSDKKDDAEKFSPEAQPEAASESKPEESKAEEVIFEEPKAEEEKVVEIKVENVKPAEPEKIEPEKKAAPKKRAPKKATKNATTKKKDESEK